MTGHFTSDGTCEEVTQGDMDTAIRKREAAKGVERFHFVHFFTC